MMYGTKFENDKVVIEAGNKKDLQAKGMEVFDTIDDAKLRGENMEYRALRREFNGMTPEELDTDRAKELEQRIWGKHANWNENDYYPGKIIENRKTKMQKASSHK